MSDAPATFRDGRYRVVRVLGEGAQATTFEAVDTTSGLRVAVKRFRVRGAKSWKEVELAEREALVLARIAHPALPRYVEHFEEAGELFLVIEKIEGASLADLKKLGVSFEERDVRALLRDASSALRYLHGRAPPIIHRDLKPSNVIRRPDGSFAFIDFGAVRDKMKPEGGSTVVGTFGYMAPEQFQGRAMPASDVYAIGATALSLLTGREPEDLPHKGLGIDVSAALAGSRVSADLTRTLASMLEPDPDRRAAGIGPLIEAASEDREPLPSSRRDRKRDRHARRRERKDARRRDREARRREGGPALPGLVLAIVLLGLTIAQIAVALALRVAVPLVLTILSLFFGKGLRRAAESVRAAGKVAASAIARARGRASGEPEVAMRVDDVVEPRLRIAPHDDEAAEEDAALEEEEGPRSRARR